MSSIFNTRFAPLAALAALMLVAACSSDEPPQQEQGQAEPAPETAAEAAPAAEPQEDAAAVPGSGDRLVIELADGEVVIALRPDIAPQHVERLKTLAQQDAYDNVAFHRVIDGFMAQTGDVQFGDMEDGYVANRAGTGGSDLPDLPAEFSDVPFERGTVGMARAQSPDSANSQFFIMFDEGAFLNGQYTVVGQVIEGMELVDAIKRGAQAANGAVDDPDRMLDVRVVSGS